MTTTLTKTSARLLGTLVLVATVACAKTEQTTPPAPSTSEASANSETAPSTAQAPEVYSALLVQGFERADCRFKQKVIQFSSKDQDRRVSICKNGNVEYFALSSSGKVTFYVKDSGPGAPSPLIIDRAEPKADYTLGKDRSELIGPAKQDWFFVVDDAEAKLSSLMQTLNYRRTYYELALMKKEEAARGGDSSTAEEMETEISGRKQDIDATLADIQAIVAALSAANSATEQN